jgi:sterol desaturase/sphingolipid hydroxylase (fatty acid hydroxylase superfamily)
MNELLSQTLHYLVLHLARAASVVFQRDSYVYWPYLLSALLIALVAWRWLRSASEPRGSWSSFLDSHFSARLWWHRSARADYWLYLANAVVLPLVFGFLLIDERRFTQLVAEAIGLQQLGGGGASASVLGRLMFTVFFFIAYDFGRFVAHCLLHDLPILWEFHKVHHSAEVLTPVTSFRAHPVELLLMAWGPLVTTGALTVVFNIVSGDRISAYVFLGTHALLFVSNLIGNLRHSPVWLSYGPLLGLWLVSPAHHQLHHSSEARHLGCNRGFELAVWDRLYGTLYVPGIEPERFRLGLGDGTESRYHSVAAMYALPFAGAARQLSSFLRRSITRVSVR